MFPEVFCEGDVLRNFAKFTGKHLFQSLGPVTLLKKRFWHRCFCCEFCEISQNTFPCRTTLVVAPLQSSLDFGRNLLTADSIRASDLSLIKGALSGL